MTVFCPVLQAHAQKAELGFPTLRRRRLAHGGFLVESSASTSERVHSLRMLVDFHSGVVAF